MKQKAAKNKLHYLSGSLAAVFAILLVVSPAVAATQEHTSVTALSIILPALALCSAIIVGVWRHTTQSKLKPIRVRNTQR
ncbi:hypothetical protein [Maritalea sp.]|uniref:hypothetical protein n=1 Tax=Maritalea sp. TaxID=2003361 RepID=UPI003EF237BF